MVRVVIYHLSRQRGMAQGTGPFPGRAPELVEEFVALMLKMNSNFSTNIPIWPIKIVLCPLVKGNGFKAN